MPDAGGNFSFDGTLQRLKAERDAIAALPSPKTAPAMTTADAPPPAPPGIDVSAIIKQINTNSARDRAAMAPLAAAATRIANEPVKIPAPPAMTPLPTKTPVAAIVDPMKQMSPLMLFLSLAGGALTQAPLTTAFKAGAAYVNGVTKGDLKGAELARQDFQDNLKTAIDTNTEKLQQYRSVLDSANFSIAEKTMRLRGVAMAFGDEHTVALLDQGNLKVAVEAMAAQAKAQETLQLQSQMMQFRVAQSFKPAALALKDGRIVDGFYSTVAGYQDVKGNPISQDQVAHFYPAVPSQALISKDTAQRAAEQAWAGDYHDAIASSGGFGNIGNINRGLIANAITSYGLAHGKSGADIAAKVLEFQEKRTAAMTLGHIVGATTQGAIEIMQYAPEISAISQSLDRTQFPTVNSVVQAFRRHTGSEAAQRMGSLIQSAKNAYVQIMTRSGRSTDQARARSDELLNMNMPIGVVASALQAMAWEAQVALSSAKQATQEVTGQKVTAPPAPPIGPLPGAAARQAAPTRSKW